MAIASAPFLRYLPAHAAVDDVTEGAPGVFVHQGDHHFAVIGCLTRLHDHVVAIADLRLDHLVASHAKHIMLAG